MKKVVWGFIAVVSVGALTVAFLQGFVEEVGRFSAVIWPIYALILFWLLVIPKMRRWDL